MERVRDFAMMEKRRHLAVAMVGQGKRQADVARHFCVSRASVTRWVQAYERKGVAGLKRHKHPGGEPKLKPGQKRALLRELRRGATALGFSGDFWSCRRIVSVIEQKFGVHYHPAYTSRLMRSLGWSYQKPAKRARERNERRIRRWRRDEFERLKTKRAG